MGQDKIDAMSVPASVDASAVRVSVRPASGMRTNDCSDPAVAERVTGELDALPFLGTLSCDTPSVVAGSVEELIFTYTVGRSASPTAAGSNCVSGITRTGTCRRATRTAETMPRPA